jgi:hypothetical protein
LVIDQLNENKLEKIKNLIQDKNIDINQKNNGGWTALMTVETQVPIQIMKP